MPTTYDRQIASLKPAHAASSGGPELSIVMPCLNEAETVGVCVLSALEGLSLADVTGEVLVADNGSTDGSRQIARSAGARVIKVAERGYGSALRGGIAASRGQFVIIGDADDSYDFREIPKFVAHFRRGAEFVQGCRFPSGGGRILPGAMPWLHRHVGNPLLSWMVRSVFRCRYRDAYCGMRGFRRAFYDELALRESGMVFAIEMVVRAASSGARPVEVPITLRPDGRTAHGPHLRTFRDGWRTIRYIARTWSELTFSPRSAHDPRMRLCQIPIDDATTGRPA